MTTHDDRIADALVAFIGTLTQVHTVEAVFQHLGRYCTELLPAEGVGVLLLEEQSLTVATANSEVGDAVEALEVELQEGPCVECVRVGHPVLVPDLAAAADRYPRFVPRALEAGAGAIHALPMTGQGELVGSLDIISLQPTELTESQLSTARMLADVAVSYIFAVRLHEETSELAGQLQNALDTRVVIEQAKGMLAERHGESLGDAFNRMRALARSRSTPVREIARQVVDDRLQP
ncbi:MAG TPA: GAF and ANTAR domain-containing protein [Acidimicrobiales bacterium]|nr:GAF and ANTAR domain-containing protein [Acidimicrobiales bacterium]